MNDADDWSHCTVLALAFMSTGEGWNNFMLDYGNMVSPLCTPSNNYLLSDCGVSPFIH